MTIAVDFDGTCVTHEFPKVGRDIGAVPVLKQLVEAGHKLILYTMRSDCKDNSGASDEFPEVTSGDFLTDAVNWFKENGIELYAVQRNPTQDSWTSSPKCYAHMYIDDLALGIPLFYVEVDRPYVNWFEVERMLQEKGII